MSKNRWIIAATLFASCSCGSNGSMYPEPRTPGTNAPDVIVWDGYKADAVTCFEDSECVDEVIVGACQEAACVQGTCTARNAPAESPCEGGFDDCKMGRCRLTGETMSCKPSMAPNGSPCALAEWDPPYKVRTCENGVCVEATECASALDCSDLEDDDYCNGVLTCVENRCVIDPDSVIDCGNFPTDQCHYAVCVPEDGSCKAVALDDDTECDDGNLCDSGDTCQKGVCTGGGQLVSCNGIQVPKCRKAVCNPKTGECDIVNGINGTPCADSNLCMSGDFCKDGVCVGGVTAKTCDQQGVPQCKKNACSSASGECTLMNLEEGTACSDGMKCTLGDKCVAGACVAEAKVCSQEGLNQCKISLCNENSGDCQVVDKAKGTPCDDGSLCTLGDECDGGECISGMAKACSQVGISQCFVNTCDNNTGLCVPLARKDGDPCDDGNPCTLADTCLSGQCKAGAPKVCTGDPGVCKVFECSPVSGNCVVLQEPDGKTCTDGNPCTRNDTCSKGACKGEDIVCSQTGVAKCKVNACDNTDGICKVINKVLGSACDDNDLCTMGDSCSNGTCMSGKLICELDCTDGLDDDGDGAPDCEDSECFGTTGCKDMDGDDVPDQNDLCPGYDDSIDANKNRLPDFCEIDSVILEGPAVETPRDYYGFTVSILVYMKGVTEAAGQNSKISARVAYRFAGSEAYQSAAMTYFGENKGMDIYRYTFPDAALMYKSTLDIDFVVKYDAGVEADYTYHGAVLYVGTSPLANPFTYTIVPADSSNFSFEEPWTQGNPPDFVLGTGQLTALKDTSRSNDGAASAKVTWTSTENQDLLVAQYIKTVAGKAVNLKVSVFDNDQYGRGRLAFYFYDAYLQKIATGSAVYSNDYTNDAPATWVAYEFKTPVPVDAVYVRPFLRFYDVSWPVGVTSATINIDTVEVTFVTP